MTHPHAHFPFYNPNHTLPPSKFSQRQIERVTEREFLHHMFLTYCAAQSGNYADARDMLSEFENEIIKRLEEEDEQADLLREIQADNRRDRSSSSDEGSEGNIGNNALRRHAVLIDPSRQGMINGHAKHIKPPRGNDGYQRDPADTMNLHSSPSASESDVTNINRGKDTFFARSLTVMLKPSKAKANQSSKTSGLKTTTTTCREKSDKFFNPISFGNTLFVNPNHSTTRAEQESNPFKFARDESCNEQTESAFLNTKCSLSHSHTHNSKGHRICHPAESKTECTNARFAANTHLSPSELLRAEAHFEVVEKYNLPEDFNSECYIDHEHTHNLFGDRIKGPGKRYIECSNSDLRSTEKIRETNAPEPERRTFSKEFLKLFKSSAKAKGKAPKIPEKLQFPTQTPPKLNQSKSEGKFFSYPAPRAPKQRRSEEKLRKPRTKSPSDSRLLRLPRKGNRRGSLGKDSSSSSDTSCDSSSETSFDTSSSSGTHSNSNTISQMFVKLDPYEAVWDGDYPLLEMDLLQDGMFVQEQKFKINEASNRIKQLRTNIGLNRQVFNTQPSAMQTRRTDLSNWISELNDVKQYYRKHVESLGDVQKVKNQYKFELDIPEDNDQSNKPISISKLLKNVPPIGDKSHPQSGFFAFYSKLLTHGRAHNFSHANYLQAMSSLLDGELYNRYNHKVKQGKTFPDIIRSLANEHITSESARDYNVQLEHFRRAPGEPLNSAMERFKALLDATEELYEPSMRPYRRKSEIERTLLLISSPSAQARLKELRLESNTLGRELTPDYLQEQASLKERTNADIPRVEMPTSLALQTIDVSSMIKHQARGRSHSDNLHVLRDRAISPQKDTLIKKNIRNVLDKVTPILVKKIRRENPKVPEKVEASRSNQNATQSNWAQRRTRPQNVKKVQPSHSESPNPPAQQDRTSNVLRNRPTPIPIPYSDLSDNPQPNPRTWRTMPTAEGSPSQQPETAPSSHWNPDEDLSNQQQAKTYRYATKGNPAVANRPVGPNMFHTNVNISMDPNGADTPCPNCTTQYPHQSNTEEAACWDRFLARHYGSGGNMKKGGNSRAPKKDLLASVLSQAV